MLVNYLLHLLYFKNFNIFLYLPILSMVGIGTGIFIGLSANYILNHFSKSSYFNKMLNLDKIEI